MSNSDNPHIGAEFQRQVMEWFKDNFKGKSFVMEKPIPIGEPRNEHKFDIASEDNSIVIECKRYTWTISGNVPSAKIRSVNEAVLYFSFLDDSIDKYIVMYRSYNVKRKQTLAEYYYETYRHLIGNVKVAEYDHVTGIMRIIESC